MLAFFHKFQRIAKWGIEDVRIYSIDLFEVHINMDKLSSMKLIK